MGSRARAEVLRILFGVGDAELHLNEIVRRSGLAQQGVDEQLRRLAALDLVTSRKLGNLRLFRANQVHPAFVELHGLVLKSSGLCGVLSAALQSPLIEVAFVFGSVARRSERAASDVDLMIFGKVADREIATLLRGASDRVGREINWHVYSREEIRERLARNDHFFSRVIESERLFVVGDEVRFKETIDQCRAAPGAPRRVPPA